MTSRARRRANERDAAKAAKRAERNRRLALGAGAALSATAALGASVVGADPAHAATFSVTNTNDSGTGSLRAAIVAANNNADPIPDVITFDPSVTGTITLTGQIRITDPIDIQGPGASTLTVDGGGAGRIFDIVSADFDADAVISGLTLTGGRVTETSTEGGGAILVETDASLALSNAVVTGNYAYYQGGALSVYNAKSASLDHVTITDNTTQYDGGGILATGVPGGVTITDSTVSNNTAYDDGGGLYASSTPVTITRSAFTDNKALGSSGYGGALEDDNSTLDIVDSVFTGNTAQDYAGGIYTSNDPYVSIEGTLVAGNSAYSGGGGVYLYADAGDAATATIANSTITANTSGTVNGVANPEGGSGGGVQVGGDNQAVTIDSSTITANSATTVGGGGGVAMSGDELGVGIKNSIVAGNTNGDLARDPADTTGVFATDFTLVQDPAAAPYTVTTPGSDLIGVNPQLGSLAANGGPTQTQLPATTSPVIDTGSTALTTDQRGLTRPVDLTRVPNSTVTGANGADMGAVERQASEEPKPPTTGNSTCDGVAATIVAVPGVPTTGTPGPDVIVGTSGADTIDGAGGDDLICGAGGDDTITGSDGNDTIEGGAGADVIRGAAGTDTLHGGDGNDTLKGGTSNDVLTGEAGNDKLSGGKGNDKLRGGTGNDALKGKSGNDKLAGKAGNDKLLGGRGNDTLKGGKGNDKLTGGTGKNKLKGGKGKNTLHNH